MTEEQDSIHFWDLGPAPKASARELVAKIRKGWQLKQLSVPYCSAGGCGHYTNVLVGPGGELCQVTDNACAAAGVAPSGMLKERTEVLVLDVPFAEKDAAKALGARWMPKPVGGWCIRPEDAERFAKWLPEQPRIIDALRSDVTAEAQLAAGGPRFGL